MKDTGSEWSSAELQAYYDPTITMLFNVETEGMVVETTQNFGDTDGRSKGGSSNWDSEYVNVVFGPLASITFDEPSSAAPVQNREEVYR